MTHEYERQRLPAALRALATRLGGAFGGLSAGARARLASACASFAELVEAGEDRGVNLRGWPAFLFCALFAVEVTALSLTPADEVWLVAEVEAHVHGARSALDGRTVEAT